MAMWSSVELTEMHMHGILRDILVFITRAPNEKNRRCSNFKSVVLELSIYLRYIKPDYKSWCCKAIFSQFVLDLKGLSAKNWVSSSDFWISLDVSCAKMPGPIKFIASCYFMLQYISQCDSRMISTLVYADDIILLTEKEQDLQKLLDVVHT